jgi:hypothetical protein
MFEKLNRFIHLPTGHTISHDSIQMQ